MHCFPQVDGGNFKEEKAASASLSPRSQTKFEIISDLFSYSNKFTFISFQQIHLRRHFQNLFQIQVGEVRVPVTN